MWKHTKVTLNYGVSMSHPAMYLLSVLTDSTATCLEIYLKTRINGKHCTSMTVSTSSLAKGTQLQCSPMLPVESNGVTTPR